MNVTKDKALPKKRRWVKLGEICEFVYGSGLTAIQRDSEGQIPVYGSNGIVGYHSKAVTSGPTIIIGRKGSIGEIHFSPGPCWPIDTTYYIEKTKLETDLYWLFFTLKALELGKLNKAAAVPGLNREDAYYQKTPFPPLPEQQRIAAILNEQMAAVERARAAAEEQINTLDTLVVAYLRESLSGKSLRKEKIVDLLDEIKKGVGKDWNRYPVIGATRAGAAPAKEKVGKQPERYKLVEPGTVFYNPMRINIGSIGMLDNGDVPGITSPDYVVVKPRAGRLHPVWFYHWLRSQYGEAFIKTLARGAVRERMLFNRLAEGFIEIPSWAAQCECAEKLRMVKNAKQIVAKQVETMSSLPAAILRRAFNGDM